MNHRKPTLYDPFIAPLCTETIQILYEDEYLLVIEKPTGLLSLSGKNPLNKDSVHYRLVQNYPTATMVHRLDFGTSGLMVVALNKAVNGELTKQFQERSVVKKLYRHIARAFSRRRRCYRCTHSKGRLPAPEGLS